MSDHFFEHPILNSPYEIPNRHWELDQSGQPTQQIVDDRRKAEFITPIPKPRKVKPKGKQQKELVLDEGKGLSSKGQAYDPTSIINEIRRYVGEWRTIPDPGKWQVTPETARLLQHWRHHPFSSIRPFFCQVEAVETAIWLAEVAPKLGKAGKKILDHLENANAEANPELMRIALKLATGAGKTTVMAMLIAWQTVNAVRRPSSKKFTRGFLIVAPGLTIRDRLRVLQPNDPDSYYKHREMVPSDMLGDIGKAKIVVTNYHAFKLRERTDVSKGTRAALEGWREEKLETLETEGQMLQRVMPDLMGMHSVMVMNDEAHHCYRAKVGDDEEGQLKGDERKEADKNREAARLWINGLEAVNRKLGVTRVMDLSATPFFLRGSGYAEGTLFPWTMSDFSLMDAIECGIVKLPRVPVADNIPGKDMPIYRNLWEHISKDMPKKGRGKAEGLDPLKIPTLLKSALEALYGHYQRTFELWKDGGIKVPPCFIIVCNNTSASKLVYDYVSGFYREQPDGTTTLENGRLPLFRNFDEDGKQLARPNTLLIDSQQLESGEALDKKFREMASDEIERFRKEIIERTGNREQADNISEQDLLREVMNTVGKQGRLGESIRCVVSVSMLTEGWDANNVTHVLGVRAFGTQLLCEQVIGRALRRQSYDLNEEGFFNTEYADVLGIPFDFTAKPVVAPPQKPRETVQVKAVRPDRDHLEIRFPRVEGYRVELPTERLDAEFTENSTLVLTPELTGPSETKNAGIIGQDVDLSLEHTKDMRRKTLVYHLTKHLLFTKWRDPGDDPKLSLFGQLKRITERWLDECLECKGGTYPAQLRYQELADMACERITAAITQKLSDDCPIKAVLDPYNPVGSTNFVNFNTSKEHRWETDSRKCHVNWVVLDSDWEAEFCRVAESHPQVKAYVKNHSLGFEVPYKHGSESRHYRPDFIVLVDDGHGEDDLLHLVVEVKGYRGEDVKDKHNTMDSYWIPGVNRLESFGRWAFVELADVFEMETDFEAKVESKFNDMIDSVTQQDASRRNLPTAEMQSVMGDEDKSPIRVAYERRNRDLDPQLVWRGKDEQDWSDLVVNAPPLYIQEKVHPKVLIDDLLRRTKDAEESSKPLHQLDLFADFNGLPAEARSTEFYEHDANWTNRMILGDSLQVMASLAEREGLRGQVQCIYIDPPYGIKFNSNFQWSTTSRDVKDGKADHITREPEQVKAFRDTWRDGIHSYLTYLRDRLTVARDLLSDSGSIFVQIGDENVHRIRALMEEIFGDENFLSLISVSKTTSSTNDYLSGVADYVLWFGKNREVTKYRQLYNLKLVGESGASHYSSVLCPDGTRRRASPQEKAGSVPLKEGEVFYTSSDLQSASMGREKGEGAASWFPVEVAGRTYRPTMQTRWKTSELGMERLKFAGRVMPLKSSIRYLRRIDDFAAYSIHNIWDDLGGATDKRYVVETAPRLIARCMLMATDPGDLIIDPTCGSGTTAYVAEQWGRRWITIDTSRVALTLARARIMGARYPYFLLTDSKGGQKQEAELSRSEPSTAPVSGNIRHGFVYERVPHIMLGSIANNSEIDVIWEKYQEKLEPIRTDLNKAAGQKWEEWEIPREAGEDWSAEARKLHKRWWEYRIARQKEIDASIAAKADYEYLYDKPYEDKSKVRVAGPFTVESVSPHRVLAMDEDDELIDPMLAASKQTTGEDDFMQMVLENLKTAGVQQAHKEDKITFTSLSPWPGHYVSAEGRYTEGDDENAPEKRAGIFIGPEFGTVAREDLVRAARECGDAGFDVLIACGFNYDAQSSEFASLGRIPILKARMNADLHMGADLKQTDKANLFVIFGEPDIEILPVDGKGSDNDQVQVKINGVDVFHPNTGEVHSHGADGIACWFIDTDYNEESFFVRHAYFLGANDPYKSLKTTLKAEINQEAWETLNSDTSRPFNKPKSGRIAVKVINHLGDEVMKVFRVE
ncbi:unnamed protein product [Cladocopium goreaui]|uniref:Probable type III restriction-modification enzyme HindVI Mod subunit (M.HindVI) (Probable HindV I methyltransferase) (Probable type III methyltransferase M.HindVI) n=1 Tax=Cladocopium goreaui TaxID=2562237 RepID=A0A9P1BGH2_9DINO|nr:unnamed protein product [Cladocopium goreaui]